MFLYYQVRSLTLSIFLNMEENQDEKLKEMCEKFFSLEEMHIVNQKFSPFANSVLVEAEIVVSNDNFSMELREVCFLLFNKN